jgi:hypothetical protein
MYIYIYTYIDVFSMRIYIVPGIVRESIGIYSHEYINQDAKTVDGRNPAPVGRLFIRIPFIPLFIVVQPSKVVQDFFHPQ